MKSISLITRLLVIFVLFFSSCKDDSPEVLTKSTLSGYVQKGPFLNGTSVSVSELNSDLSQTGKVFSAQIKDNLGTFELNNLQLLSPFVALKADGFYFNEVTGVVSASQLTLHALVEVTDINTLNVNIISTLEKARVEKLVAEGLLFADAKKKAIEEILAIFSMSKSDIQNSEMLDINKSGDDNAILLAISIILQGFRSEAELSELLANMSGDISSDGKLDNQALGTALISDAKFLNASKIRENLEKRYRDIGTTAQIPDFEKYIAQFIEKSTFIAVSLITYPESVDGVMNILNVNNTSFVSYETDFGRYYTFSATTPKNMSLKIKMEYIGEGDVSFRYWGCIMESNTNWKFTIFDSELLSQYFEVVLNGIPSNQKIQFYTQNGAKIRISYFENNNLVATRTRIITVY